MEENSLRKQWFLWGFVVLVIIIGTSLLIKNHSNNSSAITNQSSNSELASPGNNIVNFGLVSQYSKWIYYQNVSDGKKLYKVCTDGSTQSCLTEGQAWSINATGDWVYYINDKSKIFKIRTDGSQNTRLSDGGAGSITVVGDWIYYSNLDDDWKLYKIRTDGGQRTCLSDDPSEEINVFGDWIYYKNGNDGNRIYKMRMDGSQRTRLNKDASRTINVVNDWLYYRNIDDDKIYKVRSDGSGNKCLGNDKVFSLYVAGDWFYYSNQNDQFKLYKMRTDGSECTRLNDDMSWNINTAGDWVFYSNVNDHGKVYKIRADGSGRICLDIVNNIDNPKVNKALNRDDFKISDGNDTIILDTPYKDLSIRQSEIKTNNSINNFVGNQVSGGYTYKYYSHQYDDFTLYISNANYNLKNRNFDEMHITQITLKTNNFKTPRGVHLGSTVQDVVNQYREGMKSAEGADTIIDYKLNDMKLSFKIDNQQIVQGIILSIMIRK
jgi:hypothetical protein